jgi:hypothetical protein
MTNGGVNCLRPKIFKLWLPMPLRPMLLGSAAPASGKRAVRPRVRLVFVGCFDWDSPMSASVCVCVAACASGDPEREGGWLLLRRGCGRCRTGW